MALKRWALRLGWLMFAILLLSVSLRLSLKTPFVRNWARDFIVSKANEQLQGELTIDRLSGDLWNDVTASGIRLIQQDTLAQVDSVHLKYNIWALFGGRIQMTTLGIYSPEVALRQQANRWNVQDILVESPDTAATGESISFKIDDLSLNDGTISVYSDSLAGANFIINQLTASSSLAYNAKDKGLEFDLRDLSFEVKQTRLETSLKVESSAAVKNSKFNLKKLILATGNSLIHSTAFVNLSDSSAQLDATATPISWKDLTEYVQGFPLSRNLQLSLSLKGNPRDFGVSLTAQGDGLDSVKVEGKFQWHSSLILKEFRARADCINPQQFLTDSTLPSLKNFRADFNGRIETRHYREGKGTFLFSADQISRSPYHLDKLSGTVELKGDSAKIKLEANRKKQYLASGITASGIWSELPSIKAILKAKDINPGYWIQDSTFDGNLSFEAESSGQGWYPNSNSWDYSVEMTKSRMLGQPIESLFAKGKISRSNVDLTGIVKIRDGLIKVKAAADKILATPSYNFKINSRNFDLAALMGRNDFVTSLNGTVAGKGQGINPATMQLTSQVRIDSSIINRKYVRNFSGNVNIKDSIAVVDNASLKSAIAEGSFSLRMNMLRRYAPENELSLELNLKDVSALAPLFDIEKLSAEGRISGKLSPEESGHLIFDGNLDLSDLNYNEVFLADEAKGTVKARLEKNLEYMADVNLSAPILSGVQIQDMHFLTNGNYAAHVANGQYEFQFSSPNEGRIELAGGYTSENDSIGVRTDTFNIISDFRTLSLERPFELSLVDDTLKMDTMRVFSKDRSAYLEIGIPILSANEQKGYVRGKSLNTAVMQNCLLGQSYFKGMLSGRFNIDRIDTSLRASGNMLLSEIDYRGAHFDSLSIKTQIENDRMEGLLAVFDEGRQLVEGKADLPFKLGNPKDFPTNFFEEPISGDLNIRSIAIDRFRPLFAEAGITQTSGIFSFHGQLDGKAGIPLFKANARLNDAKLSGVSVDSVTARMSYDHEKSQLALNASVLSLRQKAAQINARIPLFINMKTFRVDLPQPLDSISVDVETDDFNLAALNDFVDRRTVRNISGVLNGKVDVSGALDDLKTDGQLNLEGGAFQLIPAGIRVDNIRSTIQFMPNQIKLTDFSAKSGKGNLNASGVIAMQKLVPGDIDISVSAKNFRVANTSKYNAVVNLDTQTKGSFTKPEISGNVHFISGFLELQNFGEKSVENVKLDSTEELASDFSIYDSLGLDLDVSFNRRFYIRNKRYLEMQIELDGTLDLLKSPGKDLQFFGTINAPNGYARPLGKEFELQEGNVTFSGDPTNPQLMIRTQYKPPQTQEDITIWYVIEGTVENPKFKYESQPPMELENIISYTLFGQPFYALDSWKQVVANSGQNTSAADVALDILLDRVETLATQKLGIDVVKIDNSRPNGENGTSITTGWYLNPKVFFAIQNVITGSTPDTSFELEYLLRKNLKLIIRQGNSIRQGVDLKWNYDY
jgi:autotransporter translocation and assembly factor TamB